jgi:hypothetical protein
MTWISPRRAHNGGMRRSSIRTGTAQVDGCRREFCLGQFASPTPNLTKTSPNCECRSVYSMEASGAIQIWRS